MPTSQKFGVNNLSDQRGVFPIILVIILTVVFAGVAGVVYKSQKEIKVRSDKTTEVSELKGTPVPSPKSADVAADQTGRLADKPFELKLDENVTSSPKFSLTPPDGWAKLPPDGNTVIEFSSPTKDKIKEGVATLNIQPNITVFVDKMAFKNFDEAIAALDKNGDDFGYRATSKRKTLLNGENVYIRESTIDLASLARQALEAQVKQEIARSGAVVPAEVVNADIEKVLEQAKGRSLSYIFYKDGYYINMTGKALDSYWSKRAGQLKQSMDTFKFE